MELTMKCYANCSYCYANRKLNDKSMLTLSEIKDVIRQAKKNGVYQIDINGGDVVLHPHIKEILQELVSCGYTPLVSTKTTLSKEMIDYDIRMLKTHFELGTVNVFTNNSTDVKRDQELVDWFMQKYADLLEDPSVEVLYEKTDFGVGD